jgi:Tfp pilus assembly protein PilF
MSSSRLRTITLAVTHDLFLADGDGSKKRQPPAMRVASQMLQQGRLEAAAENFLAVLQADPRQHEALFKLALTCNLQGKPDPRTPA